MATEKQTLCSVGKETIALHFWCILVDKLHVCKQRPTQHSAGNLNKSPSRPSKHFLYLEKKHRGYLRHTADVGTLWVSGCWLVIQLVQRLYPSLRSPWKAWNEIPRPNQVQLRWVLVTFLSWIIWQGSRSIQNEPKRFD